MHELLQLHAQHAGQDGKALTQTVLRLAQFFSFAWRNDLRVRCVGD